MDEQNIMQLNAEVQAKDAYAQEMKYTIANASGAAGVITSGYEHAKVMQAEAAARQIEVATEYQRSRADYEDKELRLKCLQTTLQFAGGDMAKATTTAQLAYDFITGMRALSEVTGGQ